MEDAQGIILPPAASGDDDAGLTRTLEFFARTTGLGWAVLAIASSRSGGTRTVTAGSPGGPSTEVALTIDRETHGSLTVAGTAPPAKEILDLLTDAVAREIDRRRLMCESELLQNAANAADAAVLIFGPSGNILFANVLADELISRQTAEELTAKVNGGPRQPLFRLLCKRVGELSEGVSRDRWTERIEVSDGSELSCLITVLPSIEGSAGRAVMLILRGLAEPPDQRLKEFADQHQLSPREAEVLRSLVLGLDTVGLADRLGISPHTVRDHIKNIFHKTATKSRSELLSSLTGASRQPPG